MSVRSILTIALAIAALAAPTASARPAEEPPAATKATTVQHYPTRPAQGEQANPRPQVTASAPADSGIAWSTIAIALAAGVLASSAIAAVTVRTRHSGRSRITA